MELVCNELSLCPLVNSTQEAEELFRNTLKSFEIIKDKFWFNHIRFPIDFQKQKITSSLSYIEWINTISNRILRDTIIKLFRPPFTDDLTSEELDEFFKSEYKIAHEDVPATGNPVGLPVAHILNMPAISFNTHPFWQKRKINISKINTSESENLVFVTYNICLETDHESKEFAEWTDLSMIELIDSVEMLRKYLNFTKYTVDFTEDFLRQLFEWKKEGFKIYKYILLLMKDVQLHPFTGGMGQTENLKNRGKEASKRITNSYPEGDRLSYFLEKKNITFVACKGHYKFH
jgi:Txe/YoeB family toxin of Txe-Axe toxin-antitoxin module